MVFILRTPSLSYRSIAGDVKGDSNAELRVLNGSALAQTSWFGSPSNSVRLGNLLLNARVLGIVKGGA